jgi:cytidylate kinase
METDYLYAILAGAAVLFFLKKNKAIEAQGENLKTKEKINEVQKEVVKLEASLEVEAEKRQKLQSEMEGKIKGILDGKDIADFFNNRK